MGLFNRLFGYSDNVQQLAEAVGAEVTNRMASKLNDEFQALAEVEGATRRVVELEKQIASLEANRDNITEGFNRKEREMEHKTGLLRNEIEAEKRQTEKDFALRVTEAKLAARETGLVEREKAFGEKMTFIEQRFTTEVGYLKDMIKTLSDRLPDATILATKQL